MLQFQIACRQLQAYLGLEFRSDWLQNAESCINQSLGPQGDYLQSLFALFLEEDIQVTGAGSFPPDMKMWHKRSFDGKFAAQVDEIVNIAAPIKQRYGPATSRRCLKLNITDGVQRVFGIEYEPIPALDVHLPAGSKILISGAIVQHGLMLLRSENVLLLGGKVALLQEARVRMLAKWAEPPWGNAQNLIQEMSSAAKSVHAAAAAAAPVAPPRRNTLEQGQASNDPVNTNEARSQPQGTRRVELQQDSDMPMVQPGSMVAYAQAHSIEHEPEPAVCVPPTDQLLEAAPRGSRDRDREALSEDFQIGTGTSVSSSMNAASATNDNPSDGHAASSCLMDEREASQANDMLPLQSAERASHAASSEFSKGNQGNIHDIEGRCLNAQHKDDHDRSNRHGLRFPKYRSAMNIQAASTPSRIGTQQLCATQLQSLDTHLAEDLPVQASSPQLSSPLLDDLDSFGQLEEATTAYKRSRFWPEHHRLEEKLTSKKKAKFISEVAADSVSQDHASSRDEESETDALSGAVHYHSDCIGSPGSELPAMPGAKSDSGLEGPPYLGPVIQPNQRLSEYNNPDSGARLDTANRCKDGQFRQVNEDADETMDDVDDLIESLGSIYRRFHGGSSEEFPIMAQAYVKVKCAASALRVRSKEAFQFGMEISVGDASMQADMTVAPKVIEHHIGCCARDFAMRVKSGEEGCHKQWTVFLAGFLGHIQVLIPSPDTSLPIVVNMRRDT